MSFAASSRAAALLALMLGLVWAAPAAAQQTQTDDDDDSIVGSSYAVDPLFVASSESFTAELRVGVYQPDLGASFTSTFGGDLGPMLSAELDVHLFRIPFLGPLAIGGSFAWTEWTGTARDPMGNAAGETGLSLVNFNVLAVLRGDALARYLDIPLILTGKIGPDFGYWQTGSGGVTQADGWSIGLRWAAQAALELDFLDRRSARRLDEEWGINHSELFFELFGSTMGQWSGSQLPVGTNLAWVAGLGFTF